MFRFEKTVSRMESPESDFDGCTGFCARFWRLDNRLRMCIARYTLFIEQMFIRRPLHTVYCQQSTVYAPIRTNVLPGFLNFEIKRFISKDRVYSLLSAPYSLLLTSYCLLLTVECWQLWNHVMTEMSGQNCHDWFSNLLTIYSLLLTVNSLQSAADSLR